MRVLIVEDEPLLAQALSMTLAKHNMLTTVIHDGAHAVALLQQEKRATRSFDCVVLDLTLPGMDGTSVLKWMRSSGDTTPVCVLTARSSLQDRVNGLEIGADDYLSKPFQVEELIARIRAITRRSNIGLEDAQMCFGNLSFDYAKGVFLVDGATLNLPKRQQAILEILFRRRNFPVSKEALMNLDEEGASVESIDSQISRLRKRLREVEAAVSVKTLFGIGYQLEEATSGGGNGGR